MTLWQLAWRASQHEAKSFWKGWTAFVVFFTFPVATGWLLGRGFAALADGDTTKVIWIALAVLVSEMMRMATIHYGAIMWTQAWVHIQTLLRANMLAAQMASGGLEAGQPVGSAGEALTHFRDDAEDVAMFIDGIIDVSAGVVFTVLAGFVLGSVNAGAAAILVIPLLGVASATRVLDSRIKAYRTADRQATAAVSGLLGDIMSASTAVKVNNAIDPTMARLRLLVDHRRHTAVRDRVLEEGVWAFSQGAADIGLGLVLIASASALASGDFAVGELALFTAYLGWMSFLPRMVGRLMARRKQAVIAFDRMRKLVADGDVTNTVSDRALPVGLRDVRVRPEAERPDRIRLHRLDVEELTAEFSTGAGIRDISFSLERGSFTVVTGPIGCGKTTLLRAIVGLAHDTTSDGRVRWNGELVDDRSEFMVPPNVGYLAQVPQLISDSVADNIALGVVDLGSLRRSLEIADVATDISEMPDGTDTMIGPRGLRLSGGQRQRIAAARALVHTPELIVLDDLSSALDVETELQLWTNLAEAGMTVLAVSHRAVAFDRADRVLVLRNGRLIDDGPMPSQQGQLHGSE